jgi:hypothetical protein
MLVAGPFRSQDVAKHAMQSNNEKGNLKVVLFANVGYEYLEVLTP